MRYKTLVRILIKTLGVYFFVEGVLHMGSYLGFVLDNLGTVTTHRFSPLIRYFLQLAIGFYLFFGGKWIVDRIIPSNRPYCHECGYDLTGMPPDKGECSECGTAYRRTAE